MWDISLYIKFKIRGKIKELNDSVSLGNRYIGHCSLAAGQKVKKSIILHYA
jgi:hypothetical protein